MLIIEGGIFIVAGAKLRKKYLPAQVFNVSPCICRQFPDIISVIDQQKGDGLKLEALAREFHWNQAQIADYSASVTQSLASGALNYHQQFHDGNAARSFKKKYFDTSDHKLKILCIRQKVPAESLSEDSERPFQFKKFTNLGIVNFLGHDILGWEAGAFHNLICNDLQVEFVEKLGLKLNHHGFFDDDTSSQKAARYANSIGALTEPVNWSAWEVYELEN